MYEQREGNGAVKDSVKRDDYLRYMKSNGFKLINEKLAGYGGHLGSAPSAPLCHQDFYFFQNIMILQLVPREGKHYNIGHMF